MPIEDDGEEYADARELTNAQPYPDSTPRILNYTTYTVVWLALSLHPIDRKSASP